MRRKKSLMAFTLVELLIVIVIIGLLTRALLPRLSNARAKANDTARKAHLRQIGTALSMYYMDKGQYPDANSYEYDASSLLPLLKTAGVTNIPEDPKKIDIITDLIGMHPNPYSYMYMSLWKGGMYNKAFALISAAETAGGANWVRDTSKELQADPTGCDSSLFFCDAKDIGSYLCTKIVKGNDVYNGGTGYCTYTTVDELRYVFLSP